MRTVSAISLVLLFVGGLKRSGTTYYFAGEEVGPYISQLCIQPTNLSAQVPDQKMNTSRATSIT